MFGKDFGKLKNTVKQCMNKGLGFELYSDFWGWDKTRLPCRQSSGRGLRRMAGLLMKNSSN